MAVQDRDTESFGMWHVTVVPAERSAGDDDRSEDDDPQFEPRVPRHR